MEDEQSPSRSPGDRSGIGCQYLTSCWGSSLLALADRTPLHPVYVPEFHRDGTTGGYLKRFSCRLCIFATAADLVAIEQQDPEAFELVSSVEQRIGFTMRHGRSLVQIVTEAKSIPVFPVIENPNWHCFECDPEEPYEDAHMNCNAEQLAVSSGWVCLESATRYLEHGDLIRLALW